MKTENPLIFKVRAQPENEPRECPAMERVEGGIPYCSDKQTACNGCKNAPENEPLTLDELRQMDGEPAWVTCKDGSGARWGIVKNTEFGLCAVVDDDTAYWFTPECGTIAYRRKPERSEG